MAARERVQELGGSR